jgi:xylulokinase
MGVVIGCDIGTSGTKAIVVSASGRVLSKATVEYPLSTPKPGWAEQSPETWWKAACGAVKRSIALARLAPRDVKAVGLSGQMHSSVLLDRKGSVLRPALLWCDTRTHAECADITRKVGLPGLRRWVSNPALEGFTLPKILWVRRNEPKVYSRIARVLLPKDYIRYRMTGEYAMEVSDAAGTLCFDVRNRRWSKELLGRLGVPVSWFPRVFESQDVCGRTGAPAAKAMGLAPGTPVVGGGADNTCGAVGNGIIRAGEVMASLGTSGVFFAHSDAVKVDPLMRVHTFCHSVPRKWYLMGVMLSAGLSLRWYRDTLGLSERAPGRDPYDVLAQAAKRAPEGSEGLLFLPYLMGERTPHKDAHARGAFVGVSARHGRSHFARAVFEGITFGMRDSLEIFRELRVPVRRVVATGGGAKSAFWRQLQADVYGTEVVTVNAGEGPAYGAAVLAMVGARIFPSVPAACSRLIRVVSSVEPRRKVAARYDDWHAEFKALYPVLKERFASIQRRLS